MKNKKMERTGQVSLFMVIGVLLLIVVGFFIYLAAFSTKERTGREVVTTQQMPTELQEINNYVVGCLDKVAKNGLEIIGRQGGYVFLSQGGTFRGPLLFTYLDDTHESSDLKLAIYEIHENNNADLPPLKEEGGSHSIELNLKKYIQQAIDSEETLSDPIHEEDGCLNDINFIEKFNKKGFEITKEREHDVEIKINDEDIDVYLNYPLKIKNKATGEIRVLNEFNTNVKVRLKKAYAFVEYLIDSDVGDVFFNAKTYAAGDFKVKTPPYPYQHPSTSADDVFVVIDDNHGFYLRGEPFMFRFARRDRVPVADFSFDIPDPNNNPRYVEFISPSYDHDEDDIVSWDWDFGDGSSNPQQNPTHTYTSTGDYSVILNADYGGGLTDSITKIITI